jgi:sigma-B regulation protein RsbU (phosphoserine phosphatase)
MGCRGIGGTVVPLRSDTGLLPTGDGAKSSAALLLECRRKYRDVQEEARGLKAVVELARGISTHLKLDELLSEALHAAVVLTGAERGYLVLLDEEDQPKVRSQFHIDAAQMDQSELAFSKSVILHTVRTGEATVCTDASEDQRFADAASVQMMDLRAVMAAPILDSSGKPFGAVYVDDPMSSGRFNDRVLKLLQAFADQVSVAIQTARLHEQLLSEEVRRQQMEVARAVQDSLIPKTPPMADHLDIGFHYRPAQEVGGDLFSFPKMSSGEQGVFIADVAGKGVPAALIMTKMHESAKMLARQTSDLIEFITAINTSFKEDFAIGSMVTASIVLFSPDASSIKCVRAGHIPFGIIRAETGKMEWHEPSGLALGLTGEPRFSGTLTMLELPFDEGDGILLATDGITEAMNPASDEYGFERIKTYADRHAASDAQQFVDGLLKDVKIFSGNARQSDDITVVYAKRVTR